jgi:CHAT domain-containing protein/lipopolysaccharide biosynthesis regulator YciM
MFKLRIHIGILCLLLLPIGGIAQSLQLADTLRAKGERYHELGNFEDAEFYYSEAYNLYKTHEDTASFLITAIYYSETLSYRSKNNEAISLLNELRNISHPSKNDSLKARIESNLGWAYNRLGNRQSAIKYYKKGLQYSKNADYTLMIGICLNNLADTYFEQNDSEKAISYYEEALSLFKNLDNLRSQSVTLSNLGSIYKENFIFDKALKYYNQSLAIRKEIGNVDLLASAYSNIGLLYKELGDFNQSLVYYQNSLEYRKQAGNPSGTSVTLNNIGTLYNQLGHPDRALEYYRQSLEVKKGFAGPSSLAISYNNIASRLWDLGQNEEAINYYKQALQLQKQTGNPIRIASVLLDLSRIALAKDNVQSASDYFEQAQQLADSTQDKAVQLRIAMHQGNILMAEDNFSDALASYQKGYAISKQMSGTAQIWPLHQLAQTYDRLGSPEAISTGLKVIELIEKHRSQTGPLSRFRAGYFKQHVNFYIEMASWLLKYEQDYAGAYQFVESAKARALTDELAAASQRLDESLPDEVRLSRAQQQSEITDLYVQLENSRPGKFTNSIKQKIRTKELDYASFEHGLVQEYPKYKRFEPPEPISLEQAKQMCDSETAILEYAISDQKIIAFLITRNDVHVEQLEISEKSTLAGHIATFREGITARASKDSLHSLSEPIYNQLIAPLYKQLSSYKNLIIIPDGSLSYLPFEALQKNGAYLVRQFNIKYAPSITGYSLIKKPKVPLNNNVIAIGNAGNYDGMSGLPDLPSLDHEIESVSSLFQNATILMENDVSEENVKSRIQENFSVAHIAAHSVIDEQNSSLSGIILGKAGNTDAIGNDGYLRNDEIYRLTIPSNMVVLSACKSGIGTIISGEGMLGLQRAFFNAGASTVVVSLWDVYDRPTTHFMKAFYTSLIKNHENASWSGHWQSFLRWSGWDESLPFGSTALTMRDTKLAMLDHPRYHHPVYWAPFVVVGR